MSTVIKTLTPTWSKIVESTEEFFLSLDSAGQQGIEVAAVATDAAPTIEFGHSLYPRKPAPEGSSLDCINRALIGPGFIYARTKADLSLKVAVSIWTP